MNIIVGKNLVMPNILALLAGIAHILNKLVYINDDYYFSIVSGRNALHVDVHMPSGFIYWCDFSSTISSQNAIRKIKPDGSYFRNVVTNGIGRNGIRGIAIDWVAGKHS